MHLGVLEMNNHALPITMIGKQGPSQLLFVDTLMAIVIAYVCLPNSNYCPRFMIIETKRHPRGTIKRRKIILPLCSNILSIFSSINVTWPMFVSVMPIVSHNYL